MKEIKNKNDVELIYCDSIPCYCYCFECICPNHYDDYKEKVLPLDAA